MRKLFVLFLLVALVPFTVGCNGLWDFDDDDDPVATSKILLKQSLPASKFAAANAIQDLTKLTYDVVIGGTTYTFIYESHEVVGDQIVVTFQRTIPTSSYTAEATALAGAGTAEVKYAGTTIVPAKAIAANTITVPSTPSATPTAVTVSVTITAAEVTVPTDVAGVVESFALAATNGVTYNGNPVSQNSLTPTEVTSGTPEFTLTFADAILAVDTTAEITIETKNIATSKKVTLTSSDLNYTYVSPTSCKITIKNATVTLDGNTEQLENNAVYSVVLKSAKVGTKYMATPGAFYIKKM